MKHGQLRHKKYKTDERRKVVSVIFSLHQIKRKLNIKQRIFRTRTRTHTARATRSHFILYHIYLHVVLQHNTVYTDFFMV